MNSWRNDVLLGTTVGYAVRFDSEEYKSTKFVYITDGLLMRDLVHDTKALNYFVVIIDDAPYLEIPGRIFPVEVT